MVARLASRCSTSTCFRQTVGVLQMHLIAAGGDRARQGGTGMRHGGNLSYGSLELRLSAATLTSYTIVIR